MSKLMRVLLLSLSLIVFLIVSCSKEENNNPLDNEDPVEKSEEVSKNFIPLKENVVVTNYNQNGNVSITYSGTDPKFVENKSVIVVDVDTMGYLRKVVSVQKQGNTINLTTKQAYFSDVFKRISFKLSTKAYVPNTSLNKNSTNAEISKALTDENGFIHPVKVVYHSRLGKVTTKGVFSPESIGDTFRVIDINKDFSNTDLYGKEGDNVHFYISEGYALFQSDAVFDFESDYTGEYDPDTKIKKSELKRFEFYLDSKAEFQTKLNLDMQAGYTKEGNPKIFDMKKITMKFLVGPVPVWISMDCDIYGKYNLFADAKMNSDWGFKSTHNLKIGGTYIRETDSFIPISEYVPTNKIFPLNIAGEINANARLEIYPRAEVLFYSFFGPYAEVVPYVEGNYNAAYQSFNNNFLAWNSNVDLGLDMRVGLKLTFLWGLFDEEFAKQNINCFNTTLWSAPYDLVLQSNIPASTGANSLIEIKYKVFDKLGIPVFAVPIHFSGDGTTNPQMVITNIDGEATVSWDVGNTEGEKNLNATIYKADGTIIKQLNHNTVITENNLPPNKPSNPNPEHNSIEQPTSLTLSWDCSDPEGDPLTYDIHFGTTSLPPLVKSNHSQKSYNPGVLSENTKYYWKIVAKDDHGNITDGDVWEFTTKSSSGGEIDITNPNSSTIWTQGQQNVPIEWETGDLGGNVEIWLWLDAGGQPNNMQLTSSTPNDGNFSTWDVPSDIQPNTNYRVRIYMVDNSSIVVNSEKFEIKSNFTPNYDLIAYYPFNGNANDESGNGYNAQVNGPTLTTDRFGNANKAYFFDGSNDEIVLGNQPFKLENQSYAFSVWVKWETDPQNGTHIFDRMGYPNGGNGYRLMTGGSGEIRYEISSSPRLDINTHFIPQQNKWYHIVVNSDISGNTKVFINQNEIASIASIPVGGNSSDLILGKRTDYTGSRLKGVIDDLRIYGRILTNDEIQTLYNEGGNLNNPPNKPSTPYPSNGATNQETSLTLTWNCSDPDNDPLTYDIYFGKTSNPPLYKSSFTPKSFPFPFLEEGTKYYWKIVAKDDHGNTTEGDVWEFTTKSTAVNQKPVVSITTPTSPQSGDITLNYSVSDAEGDKNNFEIKYRVGSVYAPVTVSKVSSGRIEGLNGVYDIPSGNHYFVWNSEIDIPYELKENVEVIVVWINPNGDNEIVAQTNKFDVDNRSTNGGGEPCPGIPTITYAGKTYNTVQIGDQCWLKENLNVGTKLNSNSSSDIQTDNGTIEKYCYDNNESNCDDYGGLYQWNEAMQYTTTEGTQGICPSGWHIPTLAEMQALETYVNDEAAKLVDESQTTSGYTATNETGFSALFAGYRNYTDGSFYYYLGGGTYFWSSTEYGSSANYMYLYGNGSNVYLNGDTKNYGFSVRCLKD